jgi:hypothetical protein
MATAGTLISDLDGKSPVMNSKDDDLVSRILADINASSPTNPVVNTQPPASMGRVISSPNPNTTYPTAIDPGTATAHMIGKDYPTAADFANMMHSPTYSSGGSMYAPVQQPVQQPALIPVAKGNMYTDILVQVKQPLLVAIIVFIVSLPIINVLIGHYLPTLLRVGGDLTTAGLVVKSLVGGFLFWFIQKVLVPLMAV